VTGLSGSVERTTMPLDWTAFYQTLCARGHEALAGIDDADRELIFTIASTTDTFWSDGLQAALEAGAADGDVRRGVLAALDTYRDNVRSALSADFGISLGRVSVDEASPVVDALVEAAASG
jgi:hypothetical protein